MFKLDIPFSFVMLSTNYCLKFSVISLFHNHSSGLLNITLQADYILIELQIFIKHKNSLSAKEKSQIKII